MNSPYEVEITSPVKGTRTTIERDSHPEADKLVTQYKALGYEARIKARPQAQPSAYVVKALDHNTYEVVSQSRTDDEREVETIRQNYIRQGYVAQVEREGHCRDQIALMVFEQQNQVLRKLLIGDMAREEAASLRLRYPAPRYRVYTVHMLEWIGGEDE